MAMATPAENDRINITICGDGGCGKSSITLRLVRSQWTHEYDPTIEDSYSVTRSVDGRPYFLSLTDTAGQEEYRALASIYARTADAFLLVYDITSPASLHEQLPHFIDLITIEADARLEQGRVAPVVLVAGNKCDLQHQRRIPAREGLEWARARGCGFMETSARECVNVEETFALLIRRVVDARAAHAKSLRHPSRSPLQHKIFNPSHAPQPLSQSSTALSSHSPSRSKSRSFFRRHRTPRSKSPSPSRPSHLNQSSLGHSQSAHAPSLAPTLTSPPSRPPRPTHSLFHRSSAKSTPKSTPAPAPVPVPVSEKQQLSQEANANEQNAISHRARGSGAGLAPTSPGSFDFVPPDAQMRLGIDDGSGLNRRKRVWRKLRCW